MQRLRVPEFALTLLFFLGAALQCGGKKATTDELGSPRPPIEAEVRAVIRKDNTALIAVSIPPDHHAYLDAGKDGVLIPIAFLWEELVKSGALRQAPKAISVPKGVSDEEVGARVLRGQGRFVFGPVDAALSRKTLRIRTQMCNDRTRICYPPSTQGVPLGGGL